MLNTIKKTYQLYKWMMAFKTFNHQSSDGMFNAQKTDFLTKGLRSTLI